MNAPTPQMTFGGTLTAADLMRAQWLHIKPRPAFAVIGMVLLALFVWSLWYGTARMLESESAWVPWLLWGCLGYFVLMFGVLLPYRVRRNYSQRKDLQRPYSYEVSEAAFVVRNGESYMSKPWSDFQTWKEGRHLFVLYIADAAFIVVPKRLFTSPEAIDAFRATLRATITRN